MANVAIFNPSLEDLDKHDYAAPPVDLKKLLPISPTKYGLGRGDTFPTS